MKIRLFAESVRGERKEKPKVDPEVNCSSHLPDGPLKVALGQNCKITVSSGSANILLEVESRNAESLLTSGMLLDASTQNQLTVLLFESYIYSPDKRVLDA